MSDRPTIHPVLSWRSAICDSTLPATTRHVALTLSIYMNERGGSAYPGGTLLAKDTGLSLRTVRTALMLLEETGWLNVVTRGGALKGQRRTATVYQAAIPTTGEEVAPVQELHQCNQEQRPVQLTTTTGAAVAPQFAKKLEENLPIAPTTVDAVEVASLRAAILAACEMPEALVTPTAAGAIHKAVSELCLVGATAAQVPAAARRYRERFPTATMTPPALAKWWPQLVGGPAGPTPASSEATKFGTALGRSIADRVEAEVEIEAQFEDAFDRGEALNAWERTRRQMVPA